MKYIKCFEEINIIPKESIFQIVLNKPDNIIYNIDIDGIIFYVDFSKYKNTNVWLEEYDVKSEEHNFEQLNKKPLNIINGVTNIIKDFIKNNNPDALIIPNIPMDNETEYKNELNKRARINHIFLKLNNYVIEYHNEFKSGYLTTVCYIVKPEFLKDNPFIKIVDMFDPKHKYRQVYA